MLRINDVGLRLATLRFVQTENCIFSPPSHSRAVSLGKCFFLSNPKEKYTLTRDNQEKRVDKFTCQRASEDCSASVPFLTEHSTKCRREITASEQGVCHTPSAITYSPAVRLHANPSDWIEKRPFENGLFSWLPLLGLNQRPHD